jgi:hypothetical protein
MITVQLTEREIDELRSSCISIHSALARDKHVSPEELKFWYELQDKLMMAKIRQTK